MKYEKITKVVTSVLALCLAAQTGTVSIAQAASNTPPGAPTGLLMDLMEVPLGIDSANPAMSWIVNDADQDEVQTAYQILVASTKENIDADKGDIWDSGKVRSSESSNALYSGPALAANSGYYWKVRTWDKSDTVSPYSTPQAFSTAVGDNWTADAIWAGQGIPDNAFTRQGWTDYCIECDFTITSTALGFSFRTNNAESNCYMWQIRSDRDVLVPHVFTNGSASINAGQSGSSDVPLGLDIVEGNTYHLKLSALGSTITTEINGNVVDSRQVTEYTYGSFGFRCGSSESGSVDNLKITTPDGTILYENDFSSGAETLPTATVSGGVLQLPKGARAYYVVSDSQEDTQSPAQRGNVIFARKGFTVPQDKEVERAIVSVTARYPGFKGSGSTVTRQYAFKLSVNGTFVGVGPHFDGYNNQYFYNTFDVTDLLTPGENAIGAIVYVLQDKRFQAQLKIDYTDGTSQTVKTDSSWKTLDGTAVFGEGNGTIGTSYFTAMCENIDARIYPYGFDTAGFDDSDWLAPEMKTQITGLAPSPVDPVIQEFVSPAEVVDKGNGNYFIDLGQEIIGGVRLTVDGVDGAVLTMLYGEELSAANTVKWQMRTGNNYREYFTLKDGSQVIENFGMKNYRYVEIQNCPVEITVANIQGVALHQKFDDSESYFISDNETLNDIYEFTKYSLKVTSQDLYVDSQSRERGPYEGDAYINGLSHYSFSRNYNLARFSNEFLTYHPEWCTEYSQMNVMSYWEDYLYTGNPEAIQKNYSLLTSKVLYDRYDSTWQLIRYNSSNNLVDWPTGERDGYLFSDYNTVINAFNYKAALDLASMAELLGKQEDKAKYTTFAANLQEGLNGLYNAETGKMVDGRDANGTLLTHSAQHASFLPLAMGAITNPDTVASLSDFLAKDGIQCSVYGTQFLLDAVYAAGNGQAGLDMLTSTGTRSWAHLIYELDATVASEAWDPALKSNMTYSHAWGSSPGNVIVRDLCGIQPLEAGYSKALVMPQLGDLQKVSVKVPNIKGYITMDIDRTNPAYLTDMQVNIPANSTAKVYVPAEGTDLNLLIVDGEAITTTREGNYLVLDDVGSGEHTFQVPAAIRLTASLDDSANFTGGQKQIQLSVADAEGNSVIPGNMAINYVSSDPAVAAVDETGLVTFAGAGDAVITVAATCQNIPILGQTLPSVTVEASLHISVSDAALTSMKLVADSTYIQTTKQTQLTLYGVYEDGQEVAIDPKEVTFQSSDTSVATVDATGLVTTLQPGDVSFTAVTRDKLEQASANLDSAYYAETLLFYDDFETADNFPGTTATNGQLFVNKGQTSIYTDGLDWTDYAVETVAKVNSNAVSLWFRAENAASNYLWQINEAEGNVLKTHVFTGASTYTQFPIVQLGNEYHPGEYNKLKIVVQGKQIRTYVNDVLVQEITDTTHASGSVGFRNGSSESGYYQYLQVSELALTASCEIHVTLCDTSALDAILEEAAALQSIEFTADSWNELQTALEAAGQLDTASTQAQIDAAVTAIRDAINSLVPSQQQLLGDLNEDGKLSVTDVVLLRKAILGGQTNPVGDMNADGSLSVTDVVLLRKAILNQT